MSFYTGRDRNGDPILHITAGEHTVAEMNSAPFDDTIFHTDMKYLECLHHQKYYVADLSPDGVSDILIPAGTTKDLLLQGYCYTIIENRTSGLKNMTSSYIKAENPDEYMYWVTDGLFSQWTTVGVYGWRNRSFSFTSNAYTSDYVHSFDIFIYNIKFNSGTGYSTFEPTPDATGREILVGDGQFDIGGIDLLSKMFTQKGDFGNLINTVDFTVYNRMTYDWTPANSTLCAQITMLNSGADDGSIGISADPTETKIFSAYGGNEKKLYSSLYPEGKLNHLGTYYHAINMGAFPMGAGQTKLINTKTLNHAVQSSDVFVVTLGVNGNVAGDITFPVSACLSFAKVDASRKYYMGVYGGLPGSLYFWFTASGSTISFYAYSSYTFSGINFGYRFTILHFR